MHSKSRGAAKEPLVPRCLCRPSGAVPPFCLSHGSRRGLLSDATPWLKVTLLANEEDFFIWSECLLPWLPPYHILQGPFMCLRARKETQRGNLNLPCARKAVTTHAP